MAISHPSHILPASQIIFPFSDFSSNLSFCHLPLFGFRQGHLFPFLSHLFPYLSLFLPFPIFQLQINEIPYQFWHVSGQLLRFPFTWSICEHASPFIPLKCRSHSCKTVQRFRVCRAGYGTVFVLNRFPTQGGVIGITESEKS